MTTPEQTDGDERADGRFRIALIDIDVINDLIRWRVYDDWAGDSSSERRGKADLVITTEMRATITLLADLLQFHSDHDKADRVSDRLYRKLLTVVGEQLYDLLFVGNLRQEVSTALMKLRDGELDLLRIKLSFEGQHENWLAGLPWEYVRTTSGAVHNQDRVFLSQHAELVLSRRVSVTTMRKLGQEKKGYTVLLVSPNPVKPELDRQGSPVPGSSLDPVDPGKLIECLESLDHEGLIHFETLVDTPPEFPDQDYKWVTQERLRSRMCSEPKPVLIHFLGHGRSRDGHGELLFSNSDGTQEWVSDEAFTWIAGNSKVLKLVFLQACESASAPTADQYVSFSGVARKLAAAGVPAVIGMQYRIKANLATAFAEEFYGALIRGNTPVDRAVEAGRKAIRAVHDDNDRLAFGLPVVYLTADQGIAAEGVSAGVAVPRRDAPEQRPCPRCEAILDPGDNACVNCGLKLRCMNVACDERPEYRDPLKDRFCHICSAPANQPQWAPDEASGIETVASSATAATAAGGVLSVLQPGM